MLKAVEKLLMHIASFSCINLACAAIPKLALSARRIKAIKFRRKKKKVNVHLLFLPFERKEPDRRWCKAERRCSCVRTGTCPTPRTPQRPPPTRFPRSQRSLRGTTELALPGDRLRTPPGRHLNTAGNPAGGKTSPSPRRKPKQGKKANSPPKQEVKDFLSLSSSTE